MKIKNKKWIYAAIVLAVVIITGVLGYFLGKEKNASNPVFRPDLDANAVTVEENTGDNKPDGIRIPGYPFITIPAGETQVNMNLVNPEGNPCYFTFELVMTEDDETIYTSKLVEPGKAIRTVELSRALEKGEYPAMLRISTTSLSDGSSMNGANIETTLVVE